MAQNDMLKRYLDAGIAFTRMTQERAEAIVRELVGAGEVGADQATNAVQDIVERSRENTERLLETVRTEINAQIGNLGLATRDDIESLRAEIAALRNARAASAAPQSPAPTATPSSPPAAKKAPAPARKASPVRKSSGAAVKLPATKAPASKAPATKARATKAPAAKRAASQPAGKKAPAAKAAAKKA